VHGVEVAYDNQIFTGHFNNFTLDEAADRPFLFDYNFEFVCSTLDDDFNEVRGHFLPIGVSLGEPEEAKLLDEIGKTNEVDTSVYKTIDLDRLNTTEEGETDPGTGRLSPPSYEGDLF